MGHWTGLPSHHTTNASRPNNSHASSFSIFVLLSPPALPFDLPFPFFFSPLPLHLTSLLLSIHPFFFSFPPLADLLNASRGSGERCELPQRGLTYVWDAACMRRFVMVYLSDYWYSCLCAAVWSSQVIKQAVAARSSVGLACREYVDQHQPGAWPTEQMFWTLFCSFCFDISSAGTIASWSLECEAPWRVW